MGKRFSVEQKTLPTLSMNVFILSIITSVCRLDHVNNLDSVDSSSPKIRFKTLDVWMFGFGFKPEGLGERTWCDMKEANSGYPA